MCVFGVGWGGRAPHTERQAPPPVGGGSFVLFLFWRRPGCPASLHRKPSVDHLRCHRLRVDRLGLAIALGAPVVGWQFFLGFGISVDDGGCGGREGERARKQPPPPKQTTTHRNSMMCGSGRWMA